MRPDDGVQRRGGSPVRVGDVLAGALERIGPKGLWTEAQLRRAWHEAVGDQIAAHAHVRRLRGDALEVSVSDPSWATELRYLTAVIAQKLNAVLGADTVRDIVVVTGRRRPR